MTVLFCLLLQDAAQVGDRVEITLTNGHALRGILRENARSIKLEMEDIQGSVTLDARMVRSIEPVTAVEKRVIEPPRGPSPGVKTPPTPPEGTRAPDPPKVDEEAIRARAIYAEFPESEGWGPARYDELKKFLIPTGRPFPKYLDVRIPSSPGSGLKSYAAADARDAKFFENYRLWLRGRDLSR